MHQNEILGKSRSIHHSKSFLSMYSIGPFCGSSVPEVVLSQTEEITIVFYSDKFGGDRLNGEFCAIIQEHHGK